MKFTKMEIKGQLDESGARAFAKRIAISYIIAATGAAAGGIAALVWAIRWW